MWLGEKGANERVESEARKNLPMAGDPGIKQIQSRAQKWIPPHAGDAF